MAGEGLPLVGQLLGHSRYRTTAGYAHLADAHLVEAAEKVGSIIDTAMKLILKGDKQRATLVTIPFDRKSHRWMPKCVSDTSKRQILIINGGI